MSTNITENIASKVGLGLYNISNHPLGITKNLIYSYFEGFSVFEDLAPQVSVKENFDALLIPEDHPSRRRSDTYYIDDHTVLRTHTSAHQSELLKSGLEKFLVCGDVYRRDEINKTHYPVFHQVEGVKLCDSPVEELKSDLSAICAKIFPNSWYRFVDSYFPFTIPSFELEVMYNGDWLELLGCGQIHPTILSNCGITKSGYAFGIGLERLAMILFEIPDIRYFWSDDERFTSQFSADRLDKFIPYSKFPVCYKDIAFWVRDGYNHNDFYSLVRETGADLVEDVVLLDTYLRGDKTSHCYRTNYRSMDRSLTNEEIDLLQNKVRNAASKILKVELR